MRFGIKFVWNIKIKYKLTKKGKINFLIRGEIQKDERDGIYYASLHSLFLYVKRDSTIAKESTI